ncbi:hypothetical protein PAMA_016592 [Pampus argenteus]
MEPPTYEEASLHPPALDTEAFNNPPPPYYDASFSLPSTPPPTYGEAVTVRPDPFPVLTPLTVTSPGITTHPTTQVGGVTPPVVVVSEPRSSPSISVVYLRDVPAEIRCPHCLHVVTTKVTYLPGSIAWFMCILLTLMGLVCGFCLIPFMVRGLQDAHHSCPHCGKHLHTYKR